MDQDLTVRYFIGECPMNGNLRIDCVAFKFFFICKQKGVFNGGNAQEKYLKNMIRTP